MDAFTRITFFFPARALAAFWIVSNMAINNPTICMPETRALLIAIIATFSILVVLASFVDTYTASNNVKFVVLLLPFYGPLCFSLPSDFDKDRVFDNFQLRARDYIGALVSAAAFLLIVIFINPIAPCLFPGSIPGGTRFDPVIIRTVPVVAALVTALIMLCLGTPRQTLGFQNVDETCPPIEMQGGDNPLYTASKDSAFSSEPAEFLATAPIPTSQDIKESYALDGFRDQYPIQDGFVSARVTEQFSNEGRISPSRGSNRS